MNLDGLCDLQVSNSSSVSFCRVSVDILDCLLLIAEYVAEPVLLAVMNVVNKLVLFGTVRVARVAGPPRRSPINAITLMRTEQSDA